MNAVIPEQVAAFISEGPHFGVLGTADAERRPRGHRVWGWRLDDDDTVTVFVPERFATGLDSAVKAKDPCSLTVSHGATFETYQLKGRLRETRAMSEEDRVIYERFRGAVCDVLDMYQIPRDKQLAYLTRADIAVTFAVQEVFNQTPGPRAGTRLAGGHTT